MKLSYVSVQHLVPPLRIFSVLSARLSPSHPPDGGGRLFVVCHPGPNLGLRAELGTFLTAPLAPLFLFPSIQTHLSNFPCKTDSEKTC